MKCNTFRPFALLLLCLLLLGIANLFWGHVHIPAEAVWDLLWGRDPGAGSQQETWRFILLQSRLPGALTAALAGAALAVAGLLLQTAFQNPLAGPSILGITSGASLGVACTVLAGWGGGALAGAIPGAFLSLGLLLLFARKVQSHSLLLIIGLLLGYLSSSLVTLLNLGATARGIQAFTFWGMGSFSNVGPAQLPLFATLCLLGLGLSIMGAKPLNALLLGPRYAQNLGLHPRRLRFFVLLTAGGLTAVVTAYCGPVAFLGLAVPHLARLSHRTADHRILLPATLLWGSCMALLCQWAGTLPGDWGLIPVNALTPLIGAPVILYVILRQTRHRPSPHDSL